MNKIIAIAGPVFSGKSTEILRQLERYYLAGRNVAYCVPDIDTRTSDDIRFSSTREEYKIPVNKLQINVNFDGDYLDSDVIAFDEAQFFTSEIVTLCQKLKDEGKTIIVGGLDMDFLRRPFGSMGNIMAIADKVLKLTAICSCGNEAIYTQRIQGGDETI
ncbi:MAG: thymidine kinase, partial [Bacteroidales bacterium]|nr:thymidine kinase [Bacteroidales bacterium]